MTRKKYDAIVVGVDHNGLTAAAYLARAGLSTLVLERRAIVGGCCVTEEIAQGGRARGKLCRHRLHRPNDCGPRVAAWGEVNGLGGISASWQIAQPFGSVKTPRRGRALVVATRSNAERGSSNGELRRHRSCRFNRPRQLQGMLASP